MIDIKVIFEKNNFYEEEKKRIYTIIYGLQPFFKLLQIDQKTIEIIVRKNNNQRFKYEFNKDKLSIVFVYEKGFGLFHNNIIRQKLLVTMVSILKKINYDYGKEMGDVKTTTCNRRTMYEVPLYWNPRAINFVELDKKFDKEIDILVGHFLKGIKGISLIKRYLGINI